MYDIVIPRDNQIEWFVYNYIYIILFFVILNNIRQGHSKFPKVGAHIFKLEIKTIKVRHILKLTLKCHQYATKLGGQKWLNLGDHWAGAREGDLQTARVFTYI